MGKLPGIQGFEIEKKIGEGGTSTVYRGFQENLKRNVAVKILKPSLLTQSTYLKRFQKEAELAAQIKHPNVVMIIDIRQIEDHFCIIMEYLGESLEDKIRRSGSMPVDEALRIVKSTAEGLDYAHARGVVHRDLKPANILFRDETPVLVDFGLALNLQESTILTEPGFIAGTFRYISPEQCKGERGEPASDIYSLGVVLYEMLTGKVPYISETTAGLLWMHMNDPVPRLPGNLKRFQPLIDGMMVKDKEKRWKSGKQVIRMIDRLTVKRDKIDSKKEESKAMGVTVEKTQVPLPYDKKEPGKKLPQKEKKRNILKTYLISAIIGFLVVVGVLIYNLSVEYKPIDAPPRGGVIEFDPPGGEFSQEVLVRLSMKEPLRFSNGNGIESDIYYTTDGSDPSKKSRKYSRLIPFDKEGTYPLKARAISKKGKEKGEIYSQAYIITYGTKGGVIKFEPDGGELSGKGTVILDISEPLKTSNGKEIETDIYYTLDGTEPTRTNGKKYETGEQVDILKNGVLKEGKYILRARVIPGVGEYKTTVYDRSYTIKTFTPPTVTGGIIKFNPMGGESRDKVTVGLSIDKPLKSQKGEMIDTEIYYTIIDNQSKKQEDWKKYTGTPVVIDREGEYTINARLISKVWAIKGPQQQSRAYIIKKSVPLPPKIETVTDVDQLDQKFIFIDVLERIKEIQIDFSGIKKVSKTGMVRITISISPGGEARLEEILDFSAEPEVEFDKFKSTLYQEIKKIKFPPLTKDGKPVNAVLVINFKKILKKPDGGYILTSKYLY